MNLTLLFQILCLIFLASCSSISLRKTTYTEKWNKNFIDTLSAENPGYTFTLNEGPTDFIKFEGLSGITFTGTYNYNNFAVDYDWYYESYNGQLISYSCTGAPNCGYSTQITPRGSGLQVDFGYKVFTFLKLFLGLRSHTMTFGGNLVSTSNGQKYVDTHSNQKYITAGLEAYYKFTNSLGLIISAEQSQSVDHKDPVTQINLLTFTSGLRWDLGKK